MVSTQLTTTWSLLAYANVPMLQSRIAADVLAIGRASLRFSGTDLIPLPHAIVLLE